MLRTVVALDWDRTFLLPGCCDPFNGKALRAGRRAAFKTSLLSGSWKDLCAFHDEYELLCLAAVTNSRGMEAVLVHSLRVEGSYHFLLSNTVVRESKGVQTCFQ